MELSARQGDGATLRTHLHRLAANTGKIHPMLVEPGIPPVARELWDAYLRLSASRRAGMGISPLALVDIEAWCRLTGVRLTPWELDTLIDLDSACVAILAKRQKDTHER